MGRTPPTDTFARRLVVSREAAGFTSAELARRAGISRQRLYTYESGRAEPTVTVACKLARALGLTVEQLCPHQD